MLTSLTLAVALLSPQTFALPSLIRLTPYAPASAQCPSTGVARDAVGLSSEEADYRAGRAAVAGQHLREWFTAVNKHMPDGDTFDTDGVDLAVIGLASSGDGIGSMLNNAGLVQAWDNNDSTPDGSRLKGLYQCMTYHTGTSSGAWLLGGLFGNEGETVTSLVSDKWATGFSQSSFIPTAPRRPPTTYSGIMLDAAAKSLAGYNPTLVDTWGRLAALHVLKSNPAETSVALSSLVNRTDFNSTSVPYPILTALNVDPRRNLSGCNYADASAAQYEIHPFEFGSWDSGIRSFSKTHFMGSQSLAGFTVSSSTCVTGFDNLGFLMGASSNAFNLYCGAVPSSAPFSGSLGEIWNDIIDMTSMVHGLSFLDEYGIIPGPFAATTNIDSLFLVDGGQGGEQVPIWPMLPAERDIGVIFAADFSTATTDHFPDGSSLYKTYVRAQSMGFSRMPRVPPPDEFVKQNLNKQPTFFGCDDDLDQAMVIYMPNLPHILGTNIPWWEIQFDSDTVSRILENGNLVATMKGDAQFPVCIGCAILSRSKGDVTLPEACEDCWERFCWKDKTQQPVQ